MEYTTLGSTDLKISKLCLGGMSFGTSQWMAGREESIKIIKKAIDYGINFIDTANIYSYGESEKIIGEAISGYRDDLVISTKGAGKMSDFYYGFNRKNLSRAINESLKRLNTDYVDIYFLHAYFDTMDVNDTVETISQFIHNGLAHYCGLSNALGYQLAEFNTVAGLKENFGVQIVQNHYNAVYREDERDVIPFCRKKNITYSPFSPIAAGFLSGKYQKNKNIETVRTKTYPVMKQRYFRECDYNVLDSVMEIASERGATPAQIALAYTVKKGFIPVIGANKIEYLESDINALDIKLTDDDVKIIESKYRPHEIIQGNAGY